MLRREWRRLQLGHFVWGLAWAICGLVITFLYSSTAFWIADKIDLNLLGVIVWWGSWILFFTALAWALDNL